MKEKKEEKKGIYANKEWKIFFLKWDEKIIQYLSKKKKKWENEYVLWALPNISFMSLQVSKIKTTCQKETC